MGIRILYNNAVDDIDAVTNPTYLKISRGSPTSTLVDADNLQLPSRSKLMRAYPGSDYQITFDSIFPGISADSLSISGHNFVNDGSVRYNVRLEKRVAEDDTQPHQEIYFRDLSVVTGTDKMTVGSPGGTYEMEIHVNPLNTVVLGAAPAAASFWVEGNYVVSSSGIHARIISYDGTGSPTVYLGASNYSAVHASKGEFPSGERLYPSLTKQYSDRSAADWGSPISQTYRVTDQDGRTVKKRITISGGSPNTNSLINGISSDLGSGANCDLYGAFVGSASQTGTGLRVHPTSGYGGSPLEIVGIKMFDGSPAAEQLLPAIGAEVLDPTSVFTYYDSGTSVPFPDTAWGDFIWGEISWGEGELKIPNFANNIFLILDQSNTMLKTTGSPLITDTIFGIQEMYTTFVIPSTGLSNGDPLEVSRSYLGQTFKPTYNFSNGYDFVWLDDTKQYRTESGSLKSEIYGQYRTAKLNFSYLSKSDKNNLYDMVRIAGKRKDMAVSLFPEDADVERRYVYTFSAKMVKDPLVKEIKRNAFSAKLELEEV